MQTLEIFLFLYLGVAMTPKSAAVNTRLHVDEIRGQRGSIQRLIAYRDGITFLPQDSWSCVPGLESSL